MSYMVYGFTEKQIVLQEVATESEAQKLSYRYCKHEVYGCYVDSDDIKRAQCEIREYSTIIEEGCHVGSIVCSMRYHGSNKAIVNAIVEVKESEFYTMRAASEHYPLVTITMNVDDNGVWGLNGTILLADRVAILYDSFNLAVSIVKV